MLGFILHFTASGTILLISYIILIYMYEYCKKRAMYISIVLTLIIGILKEVYDYIDYGSTLSMSSVDILSNVIGILTMLILIKYFHKEKNNINKLRVIINHSFFV